MLGTSHSLLERLRDRADHQAWQRMLTLYEPWLRGWLSRHDLQPADVEDVLQDILVVVRDKLPGFVHNGQPGAFRSWLRTILTNRVRHFLRGRRSRQAVLASLPRTDWLEQLEDADSDLARQWDREHDRHLVRGLLASIQAEFSPTTWQVFELLVLEDRPTAEVVERLGVTTNMVYIAKGRVLGRLRAEARGLVDV